MSLIDVDAIVRRLVTVATDAAPTDVQVLDGRDYSVDPQKRVLLIGYSGAPMTAVVDVSRAIESGSLDDTLFDVVVRCTAVEWDGETEFPVKRARAQSTLVALNDAIEADRSLGGLVYDAWMAPTAQWFQIADPEGNSIEVDFLVTVQVFA